MTRDFSLLEYVTGAGSRWKENRQPLPLGMDDRRE